MSAKVFEIAGALHKGTQQVLSDLQELNVPVKRFGEEVSDQDMLKLAEQYGRRDYVLSLISNEYIGELAKTWTEDELMQLLMDVNWTRKFLTSRDAERVLRVKEYVPSYVEEIQNQAVIYKNPKAVQALYLIGNDEKAILVPQKDMHVFLIPKNKKDAVPCCICYDQKKIIHTSIHIDSCMLLVWADGRYFYEPAKFTKMQDRYYLELEKILREMEVDLPRYEEIHWNKKGIWAMTKWLQPGKSGFAMQDKEKCEIKIDKNKLSICSGTVGTISWNVKETEMTIKGKLDVRKAVNSLLEMSGKMEYEAFQKVERELKGVIKVPKLYTDELIEGNTDEMVDLAVEGYVRLKILEEQGLSSKVAQVFSKERNIFMSRGVDGSMPLQERFLEKRIKQFETEHNAVVYYCVVNQEKSGTVANLFFVSANRDNWDAERKMLKDQETEVYKENLSNKVLSTVENVSFYIVNGGIRCLTK